ncbi:Nicotinamide mononucleotide adenylyltransferase [hydrothermal vent metagenome]|uniref:Nicotinamide mononucleotide adenylyltransferase n=1 Tax=hydrothermal vent metagenome TaxID=652676 RepID=A0A3B0YM43_9ZZZZ
METCCTLDTHQKALAINLDEAKYGTIAEIGAGQETARWFFQVGGAAGTIAKAMSAYDMKFSDSIYGTSSRYVSRDRLQSMLSHEYGLLNERLGEYRGGKCAFFAFANTVAARSFSQNRNGHGWLGIQFQRRPGEAPSQIDIHVQLKGQENVQDQETLGLLGVNLIYAALYLHASPEKLLISLLDQLSTDLLSIDMIDFLGPAFDEVDNRLMALRLVQHGLSSAAMFQADGKVVQPSDILYKKAVLVERSRFRPPTRLTMSLLDCAYKAFSQDAELSDDAIVVLSEMTLHNLGQGEDIDVQDYLQRAELLCALGKHVLISDYGEFYRLAQYLSGFTQMPIGVALGVPTLMQVFNEKYYQDLEGGILEAFGRLFKNDLRLYVCPSMDQKSGELTTVNNLQVGENLKHLYLHLLENGYIRELEAMNKSNLSIFSHDVLDKIRRSEPDWKDMVPETVAAIIQKKRLFGCSG